MKRMIYQVAVGQPSRLYKHCIKSVADYCSRYGIDHKVQTSPILWIKPDPFVSNRSKECQARPCPLPIFEKENAFTLLGEYDQIGIIDADIYVRDSAPNIFDDFGTEHDFGAVVEREMPITQEYAKKIQNYSMMQYSGLRDVDWKWHPQLGGEFMNMGMIVLNSSFKKYLKGLSPKDWIMQPRFKQFVDGVGTWKWSTDQTLLNYFIRKDKVNYKKMDWKWNGLYTAIQPEKTKEAHFIHFFLKDKLPDRGENIEQLMKDIMV